MRLFILSLFLLPALAACDSESAAGSAQLDEAPFGFDYTVVDGSVSLDDGVLSVAVQYSGGCETHSFQVATDASGGRVEAWLVHGGTPDPCEALVTDEVEVTLSVAADVLLTPDGGEISLR